MRVETGGEKKTKKVPALPKSREGRRRVQFGAQKSHSNAHRVNHEKKSKHCTKKMPSKIFPNVSLGNHGLEIKSKQTNYSFSD